MKSYYEAGREFREAWDDLWASIITLAAEWLTPIVETLSRWLKKWRGHE